MWNFNYLNIGKSLKNLIVRKGGGGAVKILPNEINPFTKVKNDLPKASRRFRFFLSKNKVKCLWSIQEKLPLVVYFWNPFFGLILSTSYIHVGSNEDLFHLEMEMHVDREKSCCTWEASFLRPFVSGWSGIRLGATSRWIGEV